MRETCGLSLVAGGAAYGVGRLVQHVGPAAYDWTSRAIVSVAGSMSGAVTHPGRTPSSIGYDVGSAL